MGSELLWFGIVSIKWYVNGVYVSADGASLKCQTSQNSLPFLALVFCIFPVEVVIEFMCWEIKGFFIMFSDC